MKRAALAAGVSVAALLCAWTASAVAAPATQLSSNGLFSVFSRHSAEPPARRPAPRVEKKSEKKYKPDFDGKPGKAALSDDKAPPVPKGLLHVIVSIDKQRATL